MPELPEVETTKRGLLPHIVNTPIKKVDIRHKKLRWPIPQNLSRTLKDLSFKNITRRGKYLLFTTDAGSLIIHLGMSGRLQVLTINSPAQKHDHLDIIFNNNKIVRYTDPRRFGAILWTKKDPLQHQLLINLGPEPLSKQFTGKLLFDLAQSKRLAVKNFIMDSKIVVGVGNIYATEALFKAKIIPTRPVNKISLPEYILLAKIIKNILKQAISKGGTTLRDFLNTSGKPGYFSQTLAVYGRAKQPCVKCKNILSEIKLGQRSSVFCSNCQS